MVERKKGRGVDGGGLEGEGKGKEKERWNWRW